MAAVRITLGASSYVLSHLREGQWVPLRALEGGPAALLRPGRRADEGALEGAIEVAEDWLMPIVRAIEGAPLEVLDETGRFGTGLPNVLTVSRRDWSLEGVEEMFRRLVDVATGRGTGLAVDQNAFLADMLLVRELAHHAHLEHVSVVGHSAA